MNYYANPIYSHYPASSYYRYFSPKAATNTYTPYFNCNYYTSPPYSFKQNNFNPTYRNLYPVDMYYVGPSYFDNRFYPVPTVPLNKRAYSFETNFNSNRQIEFSCEDAARINAVADYSERVFEPEHPDHLGAFPNFEEGRENGELRYQVVLFYRNTANFYHSPVSQFGNVDRSNVEAMMTTADRVAREQGRKAGFPTFHKGPNDYGMFLFKDEAVDTDYFSLGELGNPRNVRDIFIAVNRKARQRSYESGFPTFTKDSQGRYKVALIKNEYAELRGVAASDLNFPEYVRRFCDQILLPKRFPLRQQDNTNLGQGRSVQTSVTVSKNGRLDVTSTFRSRSLIGFHGYVEIGLTDIDGNLLHRTGFNKGVNAGQTATEYCR